MAGCGASRPDADAPTRPTLSEVGPSHAPVRAAATRTPPAVVDTGTDYVAIARSIGRYHGWLLAHHPAPARATDIYLAGTKSYGELTRNLRYLRAHHETLVAVGERCTYAVATVRPRLVTVRAHEVIAEDRTLDRGGRVVAVTRYPAPNDFVIVLVPNDSGRWRLADITRVALDATVVL